MKQITLIFLLSACWLSSDVGLIAQTIVVNDSNGDGVADGPRQLLPNTAGQQINIYVTGGAPVLGLNFNVQVADGFPDMGGTVDGPNITGVDIISAPTIFSGNNTGQTASRSDQQVWSVFTTTAAGTVSASGLLGIVTVSTVGWSSGTWTFALGNTQEGATDFGLDPAIITDGSITIVPEPHEYGLMAGLGLAGFAAYRRWRLHSSNVRSA